MAGLRDNQGPGLAACRAVDKGNVALDRPRIDAGRRQRAGIGSIIRGQGRGMLLVDSQATLSTVHQPGEQTRGDPLTKRQHEVLERLELGHGAKQIATDIGISRNAVYQHIERLRRQGALSATFTPSGQPPRSVPAVGSVAFAPASAAPRESALAALRELAGAAPPASGGDPAAAATYAGAIEGAIAGGDAVALAYELGRLDASGEAGLPLELVESALRRLSVLAALDKVEK
ncbi:MAG: HTH domain-containing protein [Solirubrobacterales bacterium]|nr:HTH domain-containing protein [Solirubrobacterales bacterium]